MKLSALNSKIALISLTALSVLSLQNGVKAEEIVADFSQLEAGESVEGLGAVHELLNIQALTGDGIAVFEGEGPGAYGAWVKETGKHSVKNGGLSAGGFANKQKNNAFTFSFAEDVTVSDFSLEMKDYGDWNPNKATKHGVYLTAFNAFGDVVDLFSLEHETKAAKDDIANNIFKSNTVGLRGDVFEATDANPFGDTLLSVSGEGITRIELTFDNNSDERAGMSSDPNVAFGALAFNANPSVSSGVDVPEPASMLSLLAIGAMGAGSALKRKRQG